MRQFILINAQGSRWSLNDTASFFYDINGLGQEHKTSYEQIGNLFVKTEDALKQKSITGKIKFTDYASFERFSLFIQHKPLKMEYIPESSSYFIDISIDKLNKKELETLGLVCEIVIKGLGTFYRPVICENTDIREGKKYLYPYPYRYRDNVVYAIQINSNSTQESPVRITVIGPCKNPKWTHYRNGIQKASGKICCSIPAGNRLIVSNERVPWEISEYNQKEEFVKDQYQSSDFNTERFLMVGYGLNLISFSHEGEGKLNLIVEGRIEYESV